MGSKSGQYSSRRVVSHGDLGATPTKSKSTWTSDTQDQNSPAEVYSENVSRPLPQFQFIDERCQDTAARKTEKRKHVMREHMRQRRWQVGVRKDSILSMGLKRTSNIDDADPSPSSEPPEQLDDVNEALGLEGAPWIAQNDFPARRQGLAMGSEEIVSGCPSIISRSFVNPSTLQKLPHDSYQSENLLRLRSQSPRSDPSPAAVDPFSRVPSYSNLPMKDQELVHFYLSNSSSNHYRPSNLRAYGWARDNMVRQAMSGPLTMLALCSLAASKLANLQGKKDDPLPDCYRSRAISILHQHLRQIPTDASDDVVASVMMHAMLDYYFPSKERQGYASMHWRAAVSIIRNQGGPSSLEKNRQLRLLLIWWDYTFHNYQSNDWNFHFTRGPSIRTGDPFYYIRESCEELLLFLRNAEHLALVQKSTPKMCGPCRKTMFKSGNALHQTLSTPTPLDLQDPYYTSVRSRAVGLLGSLLSINAALWDYRKNSTELSERYLKILGAKVVEMDLDMCPCPDTLCQILIDGIYVAEEGTGLRLKEESRPWVVGRFIKVAKRLKYQSWQRLSNTLFGFLTLDEHEGFAPAAFDFEDALRDEIMSAPLECVAPLFQRP